MTRLLPRLARTVQLQSDHQKLYPFDLKNHRPRRPKSLYKPTSPNPSFNPDAYPQSILLAVENPVVTPDRYIRHKTLPPRVYVPADARSREGEHDKPRQMTKEERQWWSSPYLRMLATSPRNCALSGRLLPSAFLLRLAPVRVNDTEPTSTKAPMPCTLVPDGLQHPKFTSRQSNRSVHIACSRQAISFLLEGHRVNQIPHYVSIPQNLVPHTSHLLRLRALQELELLIAQIRAKPKADILTNPPIRRLSVSEWKEIEENNQIPWQDAVAVINMPPLSSVGKVIEPSMSPFPLPLDPEMEANAQQTVATMCPVSHISSFPTNHQYQDVLPPAKVPLYNALALFPQAAQRAALRKFLGQAQAIYNVARHRNKFLDSHSDASNAYLLRSNSEIIKLCDMAAVAMALWRIYLYEKNILRE